MVERRNQDFIELSRRLVFENTLRGSGVYESDVLFWMGDLNYRVDIPDLDMRTILASNSWANKYDVLLKYDQLRTAMKSEKAFANFKEGAISHLPTYRFNSGLSTDGLGYDLKRKPAWTDRVLYIANPDIPVQQTSYAGHPEITMSDHRPVSAVFNVEVDTFEKKRYEAVLHHLFRKVVRLEESEERPDIKVDALSIDLGKFS
jgi:phosphatidylinositol-bisphosphatase